MGGRLLEAANLNRGGRRATPLIRTLASAVSRVSRVLNPPHKQPVPWNFLQQGSVEIESATIERAGFRPQSFSSDDEALPKGCTLRFVAQTDVPKPYKVFWQVVNTGREAEKDNSLRGGFDEGVVSPGKLTKSENTQYTGIHSIECFIIKDGLLAANSGQFIVNIQ